MGNSSDSRSNAGESKTSISRLGGGIFPFLILILVACGIQNPIATPTSTPAPPSPTAGPTATAALLPESVAGFQQFLVEASALKPEKRQEKVNRYVAQLTQAPLASGQTVFFLWQGAAASVHVIGDMNSWDPTSSLPLSRLEGSDLWYLQASFEPEARLDYQFEISGGDRQLDPLNPNSIMSETGPSSVLKMPGYVTPPELMEPSTAVPAGLLTSHTLESRFLDQTRTFVIYEPAGQIVGQKPLSLYLNDGGNYLNLINTPSLLDTLIAQRLIPPMVVVFLPPVLALDEYDKNDEYVSFLADELVPYVQENYGTDPDPAATGIMGSSLGGLAAIYTVQTRPDVFGLAAGQSVVNDRSNARGEEVPIDQSPNRPGRIYMVVGTYETAVEVDGERQNLLADNRRLVNELKASGQTVQYEEFPEGHSWGFWQQTFGRALHNLYQ